MDNLCNNCIHKDVCAKLSATGGVMKCEHFMEMPKNGRWIAQETTAQPFVFVMYHCSKCNCFSAVNSNFCRNCGADMRGAEDG